MLFFFNRLWWSFTRWLCWRNLCEMSEFHGVPVSDLAAVEFFLDGGDPNAW